MMNHIYKNKQCMLPKSFEFESILTDFKNLLHSHRMKSKVSLTIMRKKEELIMSLRWRNILQIVRKVNEQRVLHVISSIITKLLFIEHESGRNEVARRR